MMVKGLLFDLDGTLADTAPDLGGALKSVLAEEGQAFPSDTAIRVQASHGAKGLLGLGFGITPTHPDYSRLVERFLFFYTERNHQQTVFFEGIEHLLNQLNQKNMPWGIVTNKPARFTDSLVEKLFKSYPPAVVVSGDTCSHPKPHPEPMYYAAQHLGLPANELLYVGDAERDIEAGRRAGMKTLVAGWGYLGEEDKPEHWLANAILQDPLEILKWI